MQALWRKIQTLGLTVQYETDPSVNTWLKQFMALPLISKQLVNDSLQLLKSTIPSDDNAYRQFISYFEKEYMKRTSIDLWHHGCNDLKTNNSLEGEHIHCITWYLSILFEFYFLGYNHRLFTRFGLHPSIWEFIHFLKNEEATASHRITHLGSGGGVTSGSLVYSGMQSRRKAETQNKHLSNLENLFFSIAISLKEYLKSASLLIGKMVGEKPDGFHVNQSSDPSAAAEVEENFFM